MQLSARMPDLASIEVLLSIARTGSLGAAGRECGLSQQAVSARVAAMETQTGVRLVIRTKTGSRLTASGAVAAQ
nr:LysR family transcriptional regulator [Actinomycetes bacterium]